MKIIFHEKWNDIFHQFGKSKIVSHFDMLHNLLFRNILTKSAP